MSKGSFYMSIERRSHFRQLKEEEEEGVDTSPIQSTNIPRMHFKISRYVTKENTQRFYIF